jgi:hypothetical protein
MVGHSNTFDPAAYAEYSALYLPSTYAITYLVAFALSTCIISHTLLYHSRALVNGFKRLKVEEDDVHARLMRNYPEVPDWWYASCFFLFFAFVCICMEVRQLLVCLKAALIWLSYDRFGTRASRYGPFALRFRCLLSTFYRRVSCTPLLDKRYALSPSFDRPLYSLALLKGRHQSRRRDHTRKSPSWSTHHKHGLQVIRHSNDGNGYFVRSRLETGPLYQNPSESHFYGYVKDLDLRFQTLITYYSSRMCHIHRRHH